MSPAALLALFLLAAESPVGNWNMTIEVGHLGEGLRTVILEISAKEGGGYLARLTSMQNRMTEADEVRFEGKTLTVVYGSYEYSLEIDGDEAKGTVTSPTGSQEISARRQDSQLFAGDAPEPYQKTWMGKVEKRGEEYFIVTRRNTFGFTNADGFHEELQRFASQDVTITGLWRIDKIEIQKIEPAKRR
jgi:hypothetical protein